MVERVASGGVVTLVFLLLTTTGLGSGGNRGDQAPSFSQADTIGPAAGGPPNVLRVVQFDDPTTFNPLAAEDEHSRIVIDRVFDGSARVDWKTGEMQPWLAVEWCSESLVMPGVCSKESADENPLNLTVRYKLGDWADRWGGRVYFHDKREVTVEDVAFSLVVHSYTFRGASLLRGLVWSGADGWDWANRPYGDPGIVPIHVRSPTGPEGWLGVKIVDAHTIALRLARPQFDLLMQVLTLPVLPNRVWGPHIDLSTGAGRFLSWDLGRDNATGLVPGAVGTGAFRFASHHPGNRTRLDRFDSLFDWTRLPKVDTQGRLISPERPAYDPAWSTGRARPYIGAMEFILYRTPESAMLDLMEARVDAYPWAVPPGFLNGDHGASCSDLSGKRVNCGSVIGLEKTDERKFVMMGFNFRSMPMGYDRWDPVDPSSMNDTGAPFRTALAFSTDKETIISQILQGYGRMTSGPIPPEKTQWLNLSLPEYKLDVSKTNALLDAAGWPRDPSCPKIGNPAGHARRLPGTGCDQIEVLVPEVGYRYALAVAGQMLEAQAASAGINLKADFTPAPHLERALARGDFDAYLFDHAVRGEKKGGADIVEHLRWLAHCDGGRGVNLLGICSPALDRLLDSADDFNLSHRVSAIKDVQGLLMEDVKFNPIYFEIRVEGFRKDRYVVPALDPAYWIKGHDSVFDFWSLMLIEPPGAATTIDVRANGEARCGGSFELVVTYLSYGSPVHDADVTVSATQPLVLASNGDLRTDAAGTGRILFRVGSAPQGTRAEYELIVTKIGFRSAAHRTSLKILCETSPPALVAVDSFRAAPACIAPGAQATLEAVVVDSANRSRTVPGAVFEVTFVGRGAVPVTENLTNESGVAQLSYLAVGPDLEDGTTTVNIVGRAAVRYLGEWVFSADAVTTVTVDGTACTPAAAPWFTAERAAALWFFILLLPLASLSALAARTARSHRNRSTHRSRPRESLK